MGFSVWPHWDPTWDCAPPCSVGSVSTLSLDMITTRGKSVTPPRSRQGSIHKERFVAKFLLHQKCSISSMKRLNVSTKIDIFHLIFLHRAELSATQWDNHPVWVFGAILSSTRTHILFRCVSDQIGSVNSMRWEEALRRRNRRGQKGVLRSSNFKS